jgi:hypothetical protein
VIEASVMPKRLESKDVEQRYIDAMKPELGTMFYRLLSELGDLHLKWHEYVGLFGRDEETIGLLNRSAPAFFATVQDTLWENVLLHISRLTDGVIVSGRETLTIERLPQLVDSQCRPQVVAALNTARQKCAFARDWRNRHIGHRDLALATDGAAKPLQHASRQSVNDALEAIGAALNVVECWYRGSEAPSPYDFAMGGPGDALDLLRVIRRALKGDMRGRP